MHWGGSQQFRIPQVRLLLRCMLSKDLIPPLIGPCFLIVALSCAACDVAIGSHPEGIAMRSNYVKERPRPTFTGLFPSIMVLHSTVRAPARHCYWISDLASHRCCDVRHSEELNVAGNRPVDRYRRNGSIKEAMVADTAMAHGAEL